MSSAQQKWKSFFASRWFFGGAVAVFLLLATAFVRASYQTYQIHEEISRLQAEVKRREGRRLETLKLLEYVKSPVFVEDKARRELNLVKPGEQMAIITGATATARAGQTPLPVVLSTNESNPVQWWNYFFGEKNY